MFIWTNFVEFLVMILVTLSQAYGGNIGLAIITLSLVVRLAMLPMALRLARRARASQARLKALEPEIARLKRRYASNPNRLNQELAKLYSNHGYSLFDRAGILGGLLQLPIFAGLYSAISQGLSAGGRFLWIADLAQPDLLVTAIIAALTFAAGIVNPELSRETRYIGAVLPTVVTILFAWQFAAGLGLYWATSSGVNLLQAVILQHQANE